MQRLSRVEKGRIYGGDRTVMYEKMGLVEERDLLRYRRKVGIKKDVDVTKLTEEEVNYLLQAKKD